MHQDLSQSGVEGVTIIYLDKSAQSGSQISAEITKGVALIIIATPNLKKELLEDKAYSDELEQVIRENIAFDKVAPLVVQGDFASAVPSFLCGYLVRFANTQIDYEKMLMALDNPLGIIPAFYKLDKDEHYKSHWYNYLLTNLPDDVDRYVGRSELLVNMHKALEGKTDAVAITTSGVAITSMGGVGKSTLALMYGYKYLQAHCYDFVRFLNAEGEVLKSSLITLADDLGIITKNTKFDEILTELQARLAQIPRYLLILDNVTKHDDIADYYAKLKTLPGQHILVTSRDGAGWGQPIALNVFSENEALEYLQKELNLTGFRLRLSTPIHDDDIAHQVLFIYVQDNVLSYAFRHQNAQIERRTLLDNELAENLVIKIKSIVFQQKSLNEYLKTEQELLVNFSKQIQLPLVAGRELVAELGYLPLALSTAVAVIKDKCAQGVAAEAAIAEYLRDLKGGAFDMSANPVMRSLSLSLLKISSESDALKLLRYCAFLSPEHINPQWFVSKGLLEHEESREEPQLAGAAQEEVSEHTAKIMQRVYDAIAVIAHFSLVTVKDCELIMHRLMQEAVRTSIQLTPEELLESYLLPLSKALLSLYPNDKTQLCAYNTIKLLTAHMVCLEEHLEVLAKKILSASSVRQAHGRLLDCIADSYGYFGDYEQQKELLEKSRDIKKLFLATDTAEDYLNTLIALSDAYGYLNCRAEQGTCLEEAINICKSYRDFSDWENTYEKALELLLKTYSFTQNRNGVCAVLLKTSEDINVSRLVVDVVQNYGFSTEQKVQILPALLAASKDSRWQVSCRATIELAALELTPDQSAQYLPVLLAASKDSNSANVRGAAIKALAALELTAEQKDQLFPVLIAASKDSHSADVRGAAIKALAALELTAEQKAQLFPVLIAASKDPNSDDVRGAAIKALAALGWTAEQKHQIFQSILGAIKDSDYRVRANAIRALAALELTVEQKTQLLPVLIAATKDLQGVVGWSAYQALTTLELSAEQKDQLFQSFLGAIKDSDYRIRAKAIRALVALECTPEQKAQLLPVLIVATKDLQGSVGWTACQTLATLELTAEQKDQLLQSFLDAIKDSDYRVRTNSIRALTTLKCTAEQKNQLFTTFLRATKDPHSDVRYMAIQALPALAFMAEQKAQLFQAFLAATKDSGFVVRQAAIQALAALELTFEQKNQLLAVMEEDLASEPVDFFPRFLGAIKDSDYRIRAKAIRALVALEYTPEQKAQLLPVLIAATKDPQGSVGWSAYQTLASLKLTIDQKHELCLAFLGSINDSNYRVKANAIRALRALECTAEQKTQLFTTFLLAIKDPHSDVRYEAIQALTVLELTAEQKDQLLPIFLAATKDPHSDVRYAAIQALAALELNSEQKTQLLAVRDGYLDSEATKLLPNSLRANVIRALEGSAEQKLQYFPNLLSSIQDDNSDVRDKAINALAGLELNAEQSFQCFPLLLAASKDSNSNVRVAGINALAALELTSEQKAQVLLVLLAAIKDSNYQVSNQAIRALAVLELTAEQTAQIFPLLLAVSKDSNSCVRGVAINALAALELTTEQKAQCLSVLLAIIKDINGFFTERPRYGAPPVPVGGRGRQAHKNYNMPLRWKTIKVLATLEWTFEQKAQLLPTLLAASKDSDSSVRVAAINALAALELTTEQKAQCLPLLLGASKDSNSDTRHAACKFIVTLALNAQQKEKILEILQIDIRNLEPRVRASAKETLANILALGVLRTTPEKVPSILRQ